MACYCWLGGCGGVQFFGVFVLLRKPPFYGLKELLLSFLWTPKSPLYAHHLRYALACGVGGMFAYPMA